MEWYAERASATPMDTTLLFRAYDIWRHAQNHLTPDASDLDRIDAITALRRAVNHRLKSIRTTYNIDCLPSVNGRKQLLEKLQEFGIVRAAIIKDLFDVRNLIEHDDSEPPELKQCRHYADVIWYFLKSTDTLVDLSYDEFRFLHEDHTQFVEVQVHYSNNWGIDINANLCPEYVLKSATQNTVSVTNSKSRRIKRGNRMRCITGKATLSDALRLRLARGCFSAIGY
jgi:hypothetical protein